jgi:hypothetical protein
MISRADPTKRRDGWTSARALSVLCAWVAFPLGATTAALARGEVIYVKILVDEEERTSPAVWQKRLKDRVDRASVIVNQYCNIRFAVSGFDTWQSDNRVNDLNRTLREFEQEVTPAPSQVAIGFSSQYRFQKGINGLGGTRGPLHTHILLRESSPTTREPERLEALVHELGHFLGAAHSGNQFSVMRPVVADGLARSSTFRIGFDDDNAQIIRWVGAEVSALGIRRFSQLSQPTRDRLLLRYHQLAKELPKDAAAKRYIQFLSARSHEEVLLSPRIPGPTRPTR